jgi:hypothetical protein
VNEEALAHWRLLRQKQTYVKIKYLPNRERCVLALQRPTHVNVIQKQKLLGTIGVYEYISISYVFFIAKSVNGEGSVK